jgi:hypothetical protein
VLKWRRHIAREVSLALQVAGFRPVIGSNQVRIPVAPGRDLIDAAMRALAAVAAPTAS